MSHVNSRMNAKRSLSDIGLMYYHGKILKLKCTVHKVFFAFAQKCALRSHPAN